VTDKFDPGSRVLEDGTKLWLPVRTFDVGPLEDGTDS
jgi:hypothetical protein